jgi:hypothetical protein
MNLLIYLKIFGSLYTFFFVLFFQRRHMYAGPGGGRKHRVGMFCERIVESYSLLSSEVIDC